MENLPGGTNLREAAETGGSFMETAESILNERIDPAVFFAVFPGALAAEMEEDALSLLHVFDQTSENLCLVGEV